MFKATCEILQISEKLDQLQIFNGQLRINTLFTLGEIIVNNS